MNETIDLLEKEYIRLDLPEINVGDNVKVYTKIFEGEKERVQVFEGVVIRKIGVEKTFPKHSPLIENIEVMSKSKVRRSKLFYLRNLRGKAAKLKEKRD